MRVCGGLNDITGTKYSSLVHLCVCIIVQFGAASTEKSEVSRSKKLV